MSAAKQDTMTKSQVIIPLLVLLFFGAVIFQFLTWGIIFDAGYRFNYVLPPDYDCHKPEPPPSERKFIPDYYFKYGGINIPIIIIINSIQWNSTPCDIVLSKSDPTYLQAHKNYTSFTFNNLIVQYDDGSRHSIINSGMPIEKRTYDICEDCDDVIINDAITKKMNFSIIMSGYLYRNDSTVEPFESEQKYTIEKYFSSYSLISTLD